MITSEYVSNSLNVIYCIRIPPLMSSQEGETMPSWKRGRTAYRCSVVSPCNILQYLHPAVKSECLRFTLDLSCDYDRQLFCQLTNILQAVVIEIFNR